MGCHQHCASHDARGVASRRSFVAGLASTAIVPGAALAQLAGPGSDADVRFMRMAIEEARRGDFPFGAVIVRDGAVIARGRNLGRTNGDPTAHGEMVAIRRCLAEHGQPRERQHALHIGESCAMCMGAILWCHMGRLVFAASVRSSPPISTRSCDSMPRSPPKAPFAPIAITGGVLADEAMALFKVMNVASARCRQVSGMPMIALRAAKVVMVAAIALFASLVAFGNLTDYDTNTSFVQHVLSMDTIFPFSDDRLPRDHQSGAAPSPPTPSSSPPRADRRAVLDRRRRLLRQLRADAAAFNRREDVCRRRADARAFCSGRSAS